MVPLSWDVWARGTPTSPLCIPVGLWDEAKGSFALVAPRRAASWGRAVPAEASRALHASPKGETAGEGGGCEQHAHGVHLAPARPRGGCRVLAPAPLARPAPRSGPAPCRLTAELKRRWQMLQEMNCFFFSGVGTPKVWLITAFCTGSIWKGRKAQGGWVAPGPAARIPRCSVFAPGFQERAWGLTDLSLCTLLYIKPPRGVLSINSFLFFKPAFKKNTNFLLWSGRGGRPPSPPSLSSGQQWGHGEEGEWHQPEPCSQCPPPSSPPAPQQPPVSWMANYQLLFELPAALPDIPMTWEVSA